MQVNIERGYQLVLTERNCEKKSKDTKQCVLTKKGELFPINCGMKMDSHCGKWHTGLSRR